MTQSDWPARLTKVIAGEIRRYREDRGMSAQQLADKCKQLGMEIPRAVLANLENGRRATVSAAELLVLAQALQVSPLLLVVPLARQDLIEILPDVQAPTFEAARWWRGEGTWIDDSGGELAAVSDMWQKNPVDRVFEHQDLVARWMATHAAASIARQTTDTHRNNLDSFEKRLRTLRAEMQAHSLIPPPLPPELAHIDPPRTAPAPSAVSHSEGAQPQEQPVVAAIVTSPRGVLAGQRHDGKPPWTFIAGEQDAVKDENPADTAVREVKEETGLRIVAGEVIGERDHPKTGRHMIYIAAKPAQRAGLDVIIGDTDELAEVRWLSLAEADELLPGMFEPVREHLARELGAGSGS